MVPQGLGQALETIFVVQLHAPRVGGDTHKISHKDQQRLRVWRTEVAIQRGKLVLLGATGVELFHAAHKNHLEGRHERRRLRPVKDLKDRSPGQIKFRQAKIPEVSGHEALQHGTAAAILEKCLVAHQHIARPKRAAASCGSLNLRHKAAHGGKPRAPAPGRQRGRLRDMSALTMQLQNTVPWKARPDQKGRSTCKTGPELPQIRSGRGTLEPFQHIGHQRARKIAAEPLHGRRVLLNEVRQVGGGLVLLPKDVVLVLVEDLAVPPGQSD